jgi:hypothetical protein
VAQLGEVLSGMLTDVVRARMAGDAVTAQAVETYRADPALASMSVPRVSISTLTVKLNFAVSDVSIPPIQPVPVEEASAEWISRIQERISPMLPPPPPPPPTPPRPSRPTSKAASKVTGLGPGKAEGPRPEPVILNVPPEVIRATSEGQIDPLVKATVDGIVGGTRTEITAELRERIVSEVRLEAAVFADVLRQREVAAKALGSRLEVDIVAEKVAGTKPEALQSLEVTFLVEDIEDIVSRREWG